MTILYIGVKYSVILFSLFNRLLIKNMLPKKFRAFLKNFIYKKELEQSLYEIKLNKIWLSKFDKYNIRKLYFGILVLLLCCHCKDNIKCGLLSKHLFQITEHGAWKTHLSKQVRGIGKMFLQLRFLKFFMQYYFSTK